MNVDLSILKECQPLFAHVCLVPRFLNGASRLVSWHESSVFMSHADILLARHVISSPQRDEPKECLRGRLLGLLWRYFLWWDSGGRIHNF